jgi:type IV pilus assembly protein PilN
MNGINLLPWREEKRQARDKRMLISAIIIWLACAGIVFGGYGYLQILKDNQRSRNKYLTVEIKKLDKKIAQIRKLRNKKDELISRMEVIQNLQRQRNQVVQIFEDIVRKLPDGVYFNTMNKKDRRFSFTGTAQSNARVSSLMVSLGSSPWFNDPTLSVINVTPSQGVRLSQFNLGVSQRKKQKKVPAAESEKKKTSTVNASTKKKETSS